MVVIVVVDGDLDVTFDKHPAQVNARVNVHVADAVNDNAHVNLNDDAEAHHSVLADRFEVTVRTIYRVLDALRAADLPLRAEQGRGGGYALDRHYSLPPINLNAREAAVLVAVASQAIQMRLVPFKSTLSSAVDKVRGALSASAQRELIEVLKQLKYVGVPALPAPPAVRSAVEDAWFGQQPVALRYRRAGRDTGSRVVRISGVVMERHVTLLDCVDVATGEERRLRLDRLGATTAIVAPADFTQVAGEEALTAYEWGGRTARRHFCSRCGITCFLRGYLEQLGGDYVSVVLNCLDGVDPAEIAVQHWDGRNNNWSAGPRSTPWPIKSAPRVA